MLELLKNHVSVRQYTDEPISDATFHELITTAQHASSSHFVQAYSVIQVKDDEKRKKLGQLSNNEQQYNSAALALLFCADLNRLDHATKMHDKTIQSGTLENFIMATVDVSLFAQNFAIAAESKGYGLCFIGGVRNNIKEISELFNLPDHVIPLFGLTVGVPERKNEVKPRLPVENIVHVDTYDEGKYATLLREYDEIMEAYYRKRSTNQKNVTWTESMANFLSVKRREHMKDFVLSKGYLTDEIQTKD